MMVNITPKFQFTSLENTTIKELIQYSMKKNIESVRILKNDKNITNKFLIDESPTRIIMQAKLNLPSFLKPFASILGRLKKKMLLKDSTYIHYHPKPLPLSFGDVLQAFNYNVKKIVAVFDDGRYSVFCPNPKAKKPIKELLNGNQKLREKIEQRGGEGDVLSDNNFIEQYKAEMQAFWQKLAQDTNSKYFSNM